MKGKATTTFPIRTWTREEWDNRPEDRDTDLDWNVIDIVETDKAYRMDIQADAKRMLPFMEKMARSLAGHPALDCWFGPWAEALREAPQCMVWNYSGAEDMENGCWTYSWGIEWLDDSAIYAFLNVAKPE